MSIKVVLEFNTAEDAITALARYRDMLPSLMAAKGETKDAAAPKPAPAADKPAASKPTAGKTETTKTAAAETKQESSSGSSDASGSIDYATVVQPAIQAAVVSHKPAVVALLTEMKCRSGKDLKPEQYEAFMAKLAEITGGGEADLS